MQQTETYQFNLIEPSDKFLPNQLNENMEKAEAALEGLDQRVAVLETHKIVVGYHAGTGFVDLGFTPIVVFGFSSHGFSFVLRSNGQSGLFIQEGGFYHDGFYTSCSYVAII